MAEYTALLVFERLSGRRGTFSVRATFKDVVDSKATFPDGADSYQLPNVPCALVDMNFSGVGTNTKIVHGYVNGKLEFEADKSLNLPGTYDRQFRLSPVGFAPNAKVVLIERVK